jgi:hypothetical protein
LKVGLRAAVEFEDWGIVRSELSPISVALPGAPRRRGAKAR